MALTALLAQIVRFRESPLKEQRLENSGNPVTLNVLKTIIVTCYRVTHVYSRSTAARHKPDDKALPDPGD